MKKLLTIALAAFLASSCSKTTNEIPMEVNTNTSLSQQAGITDSKAINESLDNAAMIIATSLKDKAVRSFIKAEALKKFDGDYDVLYQSAKIIAINGQSFENILTGGMQARFPKINGFKNIVSNVPNFQISVPVHCSDWQELDYTPYVAIAQIGVNEKDLTQIKAYDSDGNIHFLDAKVDPDKPVIVVGISERVDEKGALKYEFEKTSSAASRINGQYTILGTIMSPNVSTIESWANGAPEIRVRVLGAKLTKGSLIPTALTISSVFYNPPRNAIDGVWYTVNTSLFRWYYDWTAPTTTFVYGSDVKVHVVEEDNGGTSVPIFDNIAGTIKSSNGNILNVAVSASFNIYSNDEDCGYATVHYGDPTFNYVYTTNRIPFNFELD